MSASRKKRVADLFATIHKKFKTKHPVFRETAELSELIGESMCDGLPRYSWFTQLKTDPNFLERNPDNESDYACVSSWLAQRLRSISANSNWFKPSDALCHKLVATDLRGTLVGDIKLPYDAFYIELPPGFLDMEDKSTGWHSVRRIRIAIGSVSEFELGQLEAEALYRDLPEHIIAGAIQHFGISPDEFRENIGAVIRYTFGGRRMMIEISADPNENSSHPFDDSWSYKVYPLMDDMMSTDDMVNFDPFGSHNVAGTNHARCGDIRLDGGELRSFLFKFVLNFGIYLNSEGVSVVHQHADEIKRLLGGKKLKRLRNVLQERIVRLKNDRVFLVGTNVTISKEFREIIRAGGAGSPLAYRTIVRGHWRNQAHGPGRALRTRKWIEPHVRGADLPTPVVGHNYSIKDPS